MEINSKVKFSIHGAINNISTIEGRVVGLLIGKWLPPGNNALINHANIYPTLPVDVRNMYDDVYSSYNYYHIVTDNGQHYYIGTIWIKEKTIVTATNRSLLVKLSDYNDATDKRIRMVLESEGYHISSISVET